MGTIILDTETTGLIKPDANSLEAQPEIIEFFGVKWIPGLDFQQMDKLHLMFKPQRPISAEINRITGITNEHVASCGTFAESYDEIVAFFMGVDTMVAHNLAFDRSMLANELLRIDKVLNFPWPPEHICTVEKSMHIEQRRLNLTRLHQYATGLAEIPGAHRAGNDVQALVTCYQWLLKEGMNVQLGADD